MKKPKERKIKKIIKWAKRKYERRKVNKEWRQMDTKQEKEKINGVFFAICLNYQIYIKPLSLASFCTMIQTYLFWFAIRKLTNSHSANDSTGRKGRKKLKKDMKKINKLYYNKESAYFSSIKWHVSRFFVTEGNGKKRDWKCGNLRADGVLQFQVFLPVASGKSGAYQFGSVH